MHDDACAPLGLADLEEDEALVIWLYRHWQDQGPTQAVAEHRLAALLRRDSIHGLLEAIFAVFRDLGPDPALEAGRSTLTDHEAALLALLAPEGAQAAAASALRCRRALVEAGVLLRAPQSIPNSELCRLERAVARRSPPLSPI